MASARMALASSRRCEDVVVTPSLQIPQFSRAAHSGPWTALRQWNGRALVYRSRVRQMPLDEEPSSPGHVKRSSPHEVDWNRSSSELTDWAAGRQMCRTSRCTGHVRYVL